MKRATGMVILFFALLFVSAGPSFADTINGCIGNGGSLRIVSSPTQCRNNETPLSWTTIDGIQAAAHGTVNFIAGSVPLPPNVTVTHTPNSGIYTITFSPNPFTPAVITPQGATNTPTCMATSRNNPIGSTCMANPAYDGTGAWSASVFCWLETAPLTYELGDADFAFLCIQQ
jgi:hypothetical protein